MTISLYFATIARMEDKTIESQNMGENSTEARDFKVYELSFHILPSVAEESLAEEFGNLKDIIQSRGGTFFSDDFPRHVELAYEVTKTLANKKERFNQAYFGWIKFEIDPDKILEINNIVKLDEKILRFLIIKTVKENTMSAKKPIIKIGDMAKRKFKKEGDFVSEIGVESPVNKEEIDKQIDALVEA